MAAPGAHGPEDRQTAVAGSPAGRTASPEAAGALPEAAEEVRPRGAALATFLYMAVVVVLWGYMYWTMLLRG